MTEQKQRTLVLPSVIPVFPLSGVILLPGSSLPLNIFEPRYLQMVRDAVAGHGLIGMIQPEEADSIRENPALKSVGCVGILGPVKETGDGRLVVRLKGVSRFRVGSELRVTTPYRQVQADWSPYETDQTDWHQGDHGVERGPLLDALKRYLDLRGLEADYDAIASAPDTVLVNTLSMIVPFGPAEKQALLEARTVGERGGILTGLLLMALSSTMHQAPGARH
ncbi:LON peptidase substrate-binding domain-containing protein [Kordiimonas marina]|uniref:LON peptidase substrate-binding domain-containing protein n=1 Tax=Kordiimonas marina TaxID=2872312 RepID=UPI001FF0E87F|nr:LON peptidase substrate-binding domain-containing protein [Kordiimonas marina]MCJ9428168.1 LON peptidase substrate-binding domain-containing protein [Kordiimonas marina]